VPPTFWGHSHVLPQPGFFVEVGVSLIFLHWLAPNCDPPDCLLSTWDYRDELLCLASVTWYFNYMLSTLKLTTMVIAGG
jgi:hypothetical protein